MLEPLYTTVATDILIVDDTPENLSLLFAILARSGYHVRAASNGVLALRAARSATPDLVLLDVVMPELDGYAVCAQLKADPRTADVPVIFLSALSDARDKVKAFESGGADYITKPLDPFEVLSRVQMHLARARAQAALRASRSQLQAIIDNAPVGIALLDTEWRVRIANRCWAALLGLPSENMARPALLDFAHPDDVAPRRERLEALARGEIARYQRETRLLHGAGGLFWGDLLVAPIPTSAGPIKEFVAIINDITERKQAEAQTSQQVVALAVLRERQRMTRELHDTTAQVLGYVNVQAQAIRELIERGQPAAAALDELAHAAREAHTDVRAFILDTGRERATLPLGLRALLAQCVEQFAQLTRLPAELIAAPDLPAQPLPPAAEAHLLRIVQEALNNVRKHAAAAHVQVLAAAGDEELRVTVRDDGRGFALPPNGASGEARYGLRSMRERAAEIGAELRIDSALGAGTAVSLVVPLRVAEPPRGQTILLVDDHPLFIEGLRNLLAARGLIVIGTARDGREAVTQARALCPDVVLMDIEMPNLDGLGALRQIMADLPDTRVVMLTAVDDKRVIEAVRAGAAGYLRKDQRAEEFFDALAALAHGEAALAPGLAARMMREISRQGTPAPTPPPAAKPGLTARQQELLALLAHGLTYKAIGAELAISQHTVRYHVQAIMTRLNLASRAELLAYATGRAAPGQA
jgi:PAS domain S-box-containing protein